MNISKLTNEEYNNLITKVLPEAQNNIWAGNNALIISRLSGGYCFKMRCSICDNDSVISMSNDQNELIVGMPYHFVCNNCKHVWEYNVFSEFIKHIDYNLEILLREYRCAFWGAGILFSKIFNFSTIVSLQQDKYILVDKAIERQRDGYKGIPILSPSVLNDGEIDVVIITTTNYYTEIKNEINSQYPNVKTIWYYDIGLLDVGQESILIE